MREAAVPPAVRTAIVDAYEQLGDDVFVALRSSQYRDSEICAELFDEADEAVLDAIRRIVEAAHARGNHCVVVR